MADIWELPVVPALQSLNPASPRQVIFVIQSSTPLCEGFNFLDPESSNLPVWCKYSNMAE